MSECILQNYHQDNIDPRIQEFPEFPQHLHQDRMSMNSMMDAMQVLKVPRNADFLQIKQAYRQAALRYHPDSALGSSNAEKFQKVTEAFQYLRKAFDAPNSRKNHSNSDFFVNHERNKE